MLPDWMKNFLAGKSWESWAKRNSPSRQARRASFFAGLELFGFGQVCPGLRRSFHLV
jgi:hypothetical protein